MRVLLYARYSTDRQDPLSIDTQLTMCRREMTRLGWTEVAVYTDGAESGATAHRPGYQAMLRAIGTGGVDIVYADAMDRLSRSQADVASLYERLRFRGIALWTRREGEISTLHIGMLGTINAQQVSATADKTRDALRHRHQMGKNPGGIAYGYEKRIEHDAAGERIRGLLTIVPAEATVIVGIFEDYAAGVPPKRISNRLNAEGMPPPRSGKRPEHAKGKSPQWGPNTITGNIARGTGILNNDLYIGRRPYEKQTYRKNPDTGKRHAFLRTDDDRAGTVAVPELRIVSDALWQRVKDRQATLARGPTTKADGGALPFFAQQRPKYLLTGKMVCGECGANYAKSGKRHFGCQGAAKKGPTWCGNRLTIRQDELDARILDGLATRMLRDDTLATFIEEYEAEVRRLENATVAQSPSAEITLAEVERQIAAIKTFILAGIDAALFVTEMAALTKRRDTLAEEIATAPTAPTDVQAVAPTIPPDLGEIYREKVSRLTEAYADDSLRAQAFERIRALIERVTLTPVDGVLSVWLRGELASMLSLCGVEDMQNAPEANASEALQIKMVAGTRSDRCRTRFRLSP